MVSGVGGASALAVLAAGGFDPADVPAQEAAPLVVGEAVDTGPFTITVDRLRAVDGLPGVSENDDATRVLAIVATVSANGSRTERGSLLTDSVILDGVSGLITSDGPEDGDDPVPAADAFVMADGSRLDAVQPGLEYEVAFVWEQDVTVPVPEAATIVLVGHTSRLSSIDLSQEWLDPALVRSGQVQVTEPESTADGQES